MLARSSGPPTRRLPHATVENWDWQRHAACREAGQDVFFGPADETTATRSWREDQATQLCRQCPVVWTCLRHALTVGENYGIWGGLTPAQRRALPAGYPRHSGDG